MRAHVRAMSVLLTPGLLMRPGGAQRRGPGVLSLAAYAQRGHEARKDLMRVWRAKWMGGSVEVSAPFLPGVPTKLSAL